MGSSHTSAYSGPPSLQAHHCGYLSGAISRFPGGCRGLIALPRLRDEHGAAFHRHVAPSGERGGPADGKPGRLLAGPARIRSVTL
jgi:hypothetical protein